eukprot:6178548-Pleurochrysis_carterae.AAC.3
MALGGTGLPRGSRKHHCALARVNQAQYSKIKLASFNMKSCASFMLRNLAYMNLRQQLSSHNIPSSLTIRVAASEAHK